ncbi:hydantoinase B/oxoprolinase family protein [Mesorhizobium silamurunense]|uniref:hydantoinase B/oxoprolinase family protein n=1 Tax=Mesorhizobium silamurunense TaxID=499528 RepID=UPI00177EC19C|nr:hydantoinase B/oxoprolinase family protein [Mesorhizobium silamurunense]
MKRFDPYLQEVLRSAYDAIAENLAIIVMRAAYSEIVRESLDYSTALCDRNGLTLAQGVTTPMHLGSFHDAIKNLIATVGESAADGDVFIFNDPFLAAGQHLPDIYVVKPLFHQGQIEGWATTLAHHSDVGGIVPGSNALGAREVFQEGLRLPVLPLMRRGERVSEVWAIIEANVRTPDLVRGDLEAQLAACNNCEREFAELVERYGIETIRASSDELHNHADRLTRAEFAALPDGVYTFEDHLDGLGDEPSPILLTVKLTVAGDEVTVDWTGSSSQVEGGVNTTLPFTKACSYAALRSILTVDVPNCQGFTRPIRVIAPAGSVLNANFPAPTGARGVTGYRMIDCIFGALAQVVPDRVAADSSGGSSLPTFSGFYDGSHFVFCETLMGTSGATLAHDGQEGVAHIGSNQANVPIELVEARYPLRIEEYSLVADSGGSGKTRGGLALRRSYRVLKQGMSLNIRSDKRTFPPHGLFGGSEGGASHTVIRSGEREIVVPQMPLSPLPLAEGDLVVHTMAGGGGWGNPFERAPEEVLEDVIDARVSVDAARHEYGVVVDSDVLDTAATEDLRRAQKKGSA